LLQNMQKILQYILWLSLTETGNQTRASLYFSLHRMKHCSNSVPTGTTCNTAFLSTQFVCLVVRLSYSSSFVSPNRSKRYNIYKESLDTGCLMWSL
jgi:hypothetical protein